MDDVDDLIAGPQYLRPEAERLARLTPVLLRQTAEAAERNPRVAAFLKRNGWSIETATTAADVPPLSVRMFKEFDLSTRPAGEIVRVLRSSSTTGQTPSSVPLNKTTTLRQSRGLVSILKSYLGEGRMPFLIADTPDAAGGDAERLGARGAAIRGLSLFARGSRHLLASNGTGGFALNRAAFEGIEELADVDVLVFGFTYILWTALRPLMEEAGTRVPARSVKVLHSGGWKKLTALKVDKPVFEAGISTLFDCPAVSVVDFYGMAEQTGVVFPDCEHGEKHVPDFAHVVIRDPDDLSECPVGRPGLIEVMSALPDSYFGQSVLTEDLGVLTGIDDCPCGRKGRRFRFVGRVERAEVRGCGDTFAARTRT